MKQKTLRYLFLLLLVFALPILMLPNSAGAWTYVNDGALPAGVVVGGALVTQGITASCPPTLADGQSGGFPCVTGTSTIFGGWSISAAVANGNDNDSDTNGAFKNSTQTCLGCHSGPLLGTAGNKTSYLLTGHKNVGRKVAGTPYTWNLGSYGNMANFKTTGNYWWTGPTGQVYVTDSATTGDVINWTNGTLVPGPLNSHLVDGTTPIWYIGIAGWMLESPFPGLMYDAGKSDASLCGKCHVTGWNDTSAYTTSNAAPYTSLFLATSQPDASTKAQLSGWGDLAGDPAPAQWVLDGVQCTQCHDQTPSTTTGGVAMDAVAWPASGSAPNYENTTELCTGCHQDDAAPKSTDKYVDGTVPVSIVTPVNQKIALLLRTSSSAPNFSGGHGEVSPQFFNSPHGRYTGTSGSYNGGARGQFGTTVYTTPSGVQTTILTQLAATYEDPNQIWQPSAYSSLFKNSVSGDMMEGRNYGCAMVCHDPHITTVDAVNAQPMQIGCNGYTYTSSGVAVIAALSRGRANHHYSGAPTGFNPAQGSIQPAAAYNCHQSNNTSGVTAAGQPLGIDITQINHPVGIGTPLGNTSGDPSQANDACVICHMPRPDNGDFATTSTARTHLFRINTNASYSTFPAYTSNTSGTLGPNNNGVSTEPNTANDGSSFPGPNAVWIDLNLACGQCHGGGASQNFTTGSITVGTATLTIPATAAANAAMANIKAGDRIRIVGAGISNSILASLASGNSDLYTNVQKIVLPINLTAGTITTTDKASSTALNTQVITNPTINGANYFPKSYLADVAANMHNQTAQVSVATSPASTVSTVGFTATLVDASTSGTNITVNWGDGNLSGNAAVSTGVAGGTFTHTYPSAGKYTVTHTAATSAASSIENIPISVPTNFTVGGTVTSHTGTALVGAIVILKQNGITKKTATSIAGGAYSFSNVPFGTYTISAYDGGYTFTPAPITVNATIAGHTIAAN